MVFGPQLRARGLQVKQISLRVFHVHPGKNTAAESRMFMAKTQLTHSFRKIFQDVAHPMYHVRVCRDHEGIAKRELEVSDFSAHATYK